MISQKIIFIILLIVLLSLFGYLLASVYLNKNYNLNKNNTKNILKNIDLQMSEESEDYGIESQESEEDNLQKSEDYGLEESEDLQGSEESENYGSEDESQILTEEQSESYGLSEEDINQEDSEENLDINLNKNIFNIENINNQIDNQEFLKKLGINNLKNLKNTILNKEIESFENPKPKLDIETLKLYKQFHEDYNEKLNNVLESKNNIKQDGFDIRHSINVSRLLKIKDDLEQIESLRKTITKDNDNKIRSVRNVDNGEKLNCRTVNVPSDIHEPQKFVLFANNNCLSYSGDGLYDIQNCDLSNTDQHFIISEINNNEEFNDIMKKVRPHTKTLLNKDDNLEYPIKLFNPTKNPGQCISMDQDGLRISPCTSHPNQQFKVSNMYSIDNCSKK